MIRSLIDHISSVDLDKNKQMCLLKGPLIESIKKTISASCDSIQLEGNCFIFSEVHHCRVKGLIGMSNRYDSMSSGRCSFFGKAFCKAKSNISKGGVGTTDQRIVEQLQIDKA